MGEFLPIIVWGRLVNEAAFDMELKEKGLPYPANPGTFGLDSPYEGITLVIDERCPARYVNDAMGVAGAEVNVGFIQHKNPRELFYNKEKGLQLLLQAKVLKPIKAGSQLFMSYGPRFWEESKVSLFFY